MEVMSCRRCKSLFNYISGPKICPNCNRRLEEKFDEVKAYIHANGKASIEDIAENCDISAKQIRQWIREERLVFASDSPVTIECERCGAPIKSGKYCDACRNELAQNLNSAFGNGSKSGTGKPSGSGRDGNRMRYL